MAGRSAAVRLALVLALVLLAPLRCDGFVVPPRLAGRLQHSGRSQAGDAAASAFLRAQWPLRKSFPEAGGPLQASVELVDAKEPVESLTPTQRKFYLLINAGCIAAVLGLALSKFVLVDSELWRGWTLQEVLLRIPIDNWNEYTSVLHDRPIFVKACTSLTVYMIGDLLAQLLAGEKVEALDRSRLARSGAAGFLGHGPMSHYWYILCDGLFNKLGLTAWWSVFPKVGVDQALWGPIWNAVYIVMLGAMQRENWRDVRDRVVSTARPLITSGLKLWVPTHMVTYGLIPQENRLLWVDSVEIIWCVILATTAAAAATQQDKGKGSGDFLPGEQELTASL